MIFVDANVFMYTVGGRHLLQDQAREFLIDARRNRTRLFTSAEVLQELLHVCTRWAVGIYYKTRHGSS